MLGGGLHHFDDGIVIASNARLVGNGTLAGLLTVQTGGTVSPGGSVGSLVLSNSPALQGNLLMEISRDSGNLTNDHIQVTGSLNYGGSLVVTDIGPDALVAGDTFQLFSATSYAGSFSGLTLPPLDPGLMWNNNLRIDGSITVATTPPPSISGVSQSGANMIFSVQGGSPGGPYELLTSTNVALPLANWITIETGNLDGLGKTALTNGINPAEPERYFRISVP
jgi:hypothetical protein